jgi:hypothetical protein
MSEQFTTLDSAERTFRLTVVSTVLADVTVTAVNAVEARVKALDQLANTELSAARRSYRWSYQ